MKHGVTLASKMPRIIRTVIRPAKLEQAAWIIKVPPQHKICVERNLEIGNRWRATIKND
jgi:hypothetical protein